MVSGLLKFEGPITGGPYRFVLIFIEDTRRVGADAVVVAQHRVDLPEDFDPERDALPFEFEVSQDLEGLTVRAHMPTHNAQDIRSGDMITMGAHAANTGQDPVILKVV
ncbi:MAG: hypothetical protein ABJD13_12980 [Paracoccaceae bacterium]